MLSHPPTPTPCPHFSFHFRPEASWGLRDLEKGHTLWIAALQSEPAGGGASRGLGAEPAGAGGRTAGFCVSHPLLAGAVPPSLMGTGKEGIEIFKDQVDPLGSPDGRILSYCGCNSPFGLQSPLPHLG